MVYSVLEFLSIIANAVAILTGLILTLTVLVKSIYSKSAGMKVNAEDFSGMIICLIWLKAVQDADLFSNFLLG